jgi:hypothetical protein
MGKIKMKTHQNKYENERHYHKDRELTLKALSPNRNNVKDILYAMLDELDPNEEIGLTSDGDFLQEPISVVFEVVKAQLLGKNIRIINVDGIEENRVFNEVMHAICPELGISFNFRRVASKCCSPTLQRRFVTKPVISKKHNISRTDEFLNSLDDSDYAKAFTNKDSD